MPYPTAKPLADRYLTAALGYADTGLPVFLLGRTKRPVANCAGCRNDTTGHDPQICECLTCHGFYAATTNPARIRASFDAISDGLLAIRTGAVSGRVVVDIDPRHGGHVDPALMAPTATVATGGGGWHLHYQHPGVPVLSRPLPGRRGVDIKAEGGYVLAPPSIHPTTRQPYRWVGNRPVVEMPPPLLAACLTEPDAAAPLDRRPVTTSGARGISSPPALLAAHLDAVARATEGRRRTTLYGAARGVARLVAAGAITRTDAIATLTDAGREAKQTERDIRAAITGGFTAEGVPA
jgi:bifunctional DNA primase/polymerase-like protein